jgi:hypothetical protein
MVFANSEKTDKATDVFKAYESAIQGWVDSGAVTLREYHANNRNTIILRFVEAFTSSEQQRVINQMKDTKLASNRVVTQHDSIQHEIGSEVNYKSEEPAPEKAQLPDWGDWSVHVNPLSSQAPNLYPKKGNGTLIHSGSAKVNTGTTGFPTPAKQQKTIHEIIDEARQIAKKHGVTVN